MKLKKVFIISLLGGVILFFTNTDSYAQASVRYSVSTENQDEFSVKCTLSYIISVPGKTPWVRLTTLVPQSIPDIQKINNVEYSIRPARIFTRNGNRYAEIVINNPGRIEKLKMTISAELYRYDLQTAISNKEKNKLQKTGFEEFLKDENFIEKNNYEIREIARSINGSSEVEIVRNIYNYVLDNMEYAILGRKDRGALYALKYKKGDCSEYTDLFAALCRAKRIPARVISGIVVQSDRKTAKHSWAEVYLEKYGWVPFDPTRGDVRYTFLRNRSFSILEPRYIYFSNVRNDIVLRNYHFAFFVSVGDRITMSDSIEFEFPD